MTIRTTTQNVPGVGIADTLELHEGHAVSVVQRRDGRHELSIAGTVVVLGEDESEALARMLGSPKLIARLAEMQHDADGLLVEQIPVPAHSPYAGDPLSATRLRGRTGASVVAVLREGTSHPMPKPEFVLAGGDTLVTVGTRQALDTSARILDGTG